MIALVTGARGFIGRHLMEALAREPGVEAIGYDLGDSEAVLEQGLATAEMIYHLAGVNRPQNPVEFKAGNADFTAELCARLTDLRRAPLLVLSSSIQATLDNPYGVSKRMAEESVGAWAKGQGEDAKGQGRRAIIFRLTNVFGKWCRPNYNSVTATFCHSIAHDLPITISDPLRELELAYIDDVIAAFLAAGKGKESGASPFEFREVTPTYRTTLGELAARIRSFRESRKTLLLPDFSNPFNRCLYATFLSYLDGPDFAYGLEQRMDPRGSLAEFVKSAAGGQIFVSRTKPGVTRGNHYHHTKTEKFLVVEGEAIIRFRPLSGKEPSATGEGQSGKGPKQDTKSGEQGAKGQVPTSEGAALSPSPLAPGSLPVASGSSPLALGLIEHRVSGKEFKVVDIPPGYTHSIENVGTSELVTLFWASEVFDPARPDTYPLSVLG